MLGKRAIVIPEDLKELAKEFTKKRIKAEKAEIARKAEEAKERNRIAEERVKSGLSYAKKIFEWAEAFRNSRTGQKLIEIGHIPLFVVRGIFLFDSKVEGKPWRGLGVSQDGMWWMKNGCGASPQRVDTPEQLAREIDTEILKSACEWIEGGRVWECIEKRTRERVQSLNF